MKFTRILPVAALGIALSVGGAQKAEAYSYAYADLEITQGLVTIIPTDTTALEGFAVGQGLGIGSISADPVATSTSSASIEGLIGQSSNSLTDAAVSIGNISSFPDGTDPTNNSWVPEGSSNGHIYSWADSVIASEQTITGANVDGTPIVGSYVATRQIAEGNTTSLLANAGSSTTSSTEFVTDITILGDGARIRFDFDAALALAAEITAPNIGDLAFASSTIQITILDSNGDTVAIWNAGSDTGLGFVNASISNGFDVTSDLTTNTPDVLAFSDSGSFIAVTENLAAGNYKLVFLAKTEIGVHATRIPSPGSLTLLGAGLFILGMRRRKLAA